MAYLSYRIVESTEGFVGARLSVEVDDVLRDGGVVVPVDGLQVVCRQDVDVLLARVVCEEHDFVCVATLQKHLHSLDAVAGLKCDKLFNKTKNKDIGRHLRLTHDASPPDESQI